MKKPDHILVIRLSAMGDVAMMVPVLKAFSETYPQVKVTLLTRRFFAPLFTNIPSVQVYEADVKGRHKGVRGLQKLSEELTDLGIDAVADLHNVLRSNILKFFFKIKGTPVKQIEKGRGEKKALTRSKNKAFKPLKQTYQRYAEVFAQLGYPLKVVTVSPLDRHETSERVEKIMGFASRKMLGIAPFAQHDAKVYPQDLMEEVLLELQKEQDFRIFLFGGGAEEIKILKKWEQKFPTAINVAGELTFEEELALISHLDLMVSMDSGNGHLAANYGVPVITLWGLTHPYTGYAPFKQPLSNSLLPDLQQYPAIPTSVYGKEVPKGYEDVMRSIKPGKVVEKIKEALS